MMLQKFALAFKTKTIEFFAEEEEEEEEEEGGGGIPSTVDLDSAEEIITGQRVVVIKPDDPNKNPTCTSHSSHSHLKQALVSSLFATVSSFHAAYLNLQTAHEPFHPDGIKSADRAAVSHLQRLSDLRRAYHDLQGNPSSPNPNLPLSSHLEAQVQENQSMLRKFETVFNRLQSDIDRKDAEASALKHQLREVEASNSLLESRLSSSALEEGEKFLLSLGVFDAVLKEACRAAHRFTKILIDLLKRSGWDLESAANSIHPGVDYAKRGHSGYALLSYICLGMFGGFGSPCFGLEGGRIGSNADELSLRSREFLRQFFEHCSVDSVELLSREPKCDFAKFCERKYRQLIHPDMETSLFGKIERGDSAIGSWWPSSPLYEPFVNMGCLVWMLHKLAMAFDGAIEIFQVQQGVDFSMVYMESVVRRKRSMGFDDVGRPRPKVGFTVVPGFRVGATVIQCRVYLNCMNCLLDSTFNNVNYK